MPKIVLSNNPAIRLDFLAYCVWPKEQEKRDAYIALTNSKSVSMLREVQGDASIRSVFVEGHYELFKAAKNQEFRSLVFDQTAVEEAVNSGFGIIQLEDQLNASLKQMFLTGYVVCAFATMIEHHIDDKDIRGGPGIKKAQEIVAEIQSLSISTVENAWSNYKTVGHFLAAAFVLSNDPYCGQHRFDHYIATAHHELVPISQYYRILLTQFVPRGRSEPLLTENEIWTPPEELDTPHALGIDGPPLPKKILKAIKARTAKRRKG